MKCVFVGVSTRDAILDPRGRPFREDGKVIMTQSFQFQPGAWPFSPPGY
jgi:hypothetical protein